MEKMTIIDVDDREHSSETVDYLSTIEDASRNIERLKPGDYRQTNNLQVERKTLLDFTHELYKTRIAIAAHQSEDETQFSQISGIHPC